jgi:hypothetical protein
LIARLDFKPGFVVLAHESDWTVCLAISGCRFGCEETSHMFQKMILVMLAEIARQDVNLVLKGTTRAVPLTSCLS